jgi:hypothetical protein
MSHYRKIFFRDGATVTIENGVITDGAFPPEVTRTATIMPDLEQHYGAPVISPIDGAVMSSRSHMREHNKRHGVIQTGDIIGEAAREKTRQHMKYDPSLIGNSSEFSWTSPARR